ncbi:hypothetical protein HANVADRAFT_82293 [Hanseniaspora valbyensis NRRL Y-1626]|uniref:Cation/H+ exchanger domain-containing protein n=1 Tax=Hanseniaspora valbyensis NRRL Y-1626 TaxID=766949 RepID=A0A1B7TIV1_9ASCO|nr:hypothetical protein HANVADRAFT_82293 [Hanseniaspora valbyensis NRRL Y-1626]
MVWSHLAPTKAHVSYALISVFSIVFSLVSFIIKEKLYIGEASVSTIFGIIIGPHALNWVNPNNWGNRDSIILEISRLLLCIQIFATAVELPKKYLMKHWVSVLMLLVPIMTIGWLSMGFLTYAIMPGMSIGEGLLLAACITSTDPVLSQSIITGNFAKNHVPKHLRNLIGCESGCNDGMAFPFIYLSINIMVFHGKKRVNNIVKEWICITILYECTVGCIIGVFIGYTARHAIKYAVKRNTIDRESFLAFYLILAVLCAGVGSILQVDDLLVSFAAGAAFAWDGWFSKKTRESGLTSVIDLLLNYSYFIIFGAIIPWNEFNSHYLGLDVWRLILLAIVMIFLKRIPAVLLLWKFIPDLKNFREAMFTSMWGTTGVGAIYACILARMTLEEYTVEHDEGVTHHTPLSSLPPADSKYYRIIYLLWPITTFWVLVSIIVHGTTIAVIMLGKKINAISVTRTWTVNTRTLTRRGSHNTMTNRKNVGPEEEDWLNRLPKNGNFREEKETLVRNNNNNNNNNINGDDSIENVSFDKEDVNLTDSDQVINQRSQASIGNLSKVNSRNKDDDDDDGASISEFFSRSNTRQSASSSTAQPQIKKPLKKRSGNNKIMKKLKKFKYKRQKFMGQETDIDKNIDKLGKERVKREEAAANDAFKLGPQLENGVSEERPIDDEFTESAHPVSLKRIHTPPPPNISGNYYGTDEEEGDESLSQDSLENEYTEDGEVMTSDEEEELNNDGEEEETDEDEDLQYDTVHLPPFLEQPKSQSKETNTLQKIQSHMSHNSTNSGKSTRQYLNELSRVYSLQQSIQPLQTYEVGDSLIIENEDGDVLKQIAITPDPDFKEQYEKNNNKIYHGKYYAYQVNDKYIIEDENGDIVRKYKINTEEEENKERQNEGGRSRRNSLAHKLRLRESKNKDILTKIKDRFSKKDN